MLASCASNELAKINNSVNSQIQYKSDESDYWQTPNETETLKTGDCEDFAILKWKEFIDSGINEEDIDFVLVQLNNSKTWHLMIYHNGIYYDNTKWNRWYYDEDFVLIERFNRFNMPKTLHIRKSFNDMLGRI